MSANQKKSSSIMIRKLCIEDYDRLISLWQDAKLLHKPKGRDKRDHIECELKKPNVLFLVAEKDGMLIGSIFGTHDGRKGWINRLAVSPAYQRQRIGARLLKEAENWFYDMEIGINACLIEEWNTESMKFFEKQGYKQHRDIIYLAKRKHPDI